MYYIIFNPEGCTRGTSSMIVGTVADLFAAVDVLERATAQYKVFEGVICLRPEMFGLGETEGWLSLDASFDNVHVVVAKPVTLLSGLSPTS